jgi:hypothetical protein
MRRVGIAVMAALALLVPAGAGVAASKPAPRWRTLAPMKNPRTEAAFALSGLEVYAVGGFVHSLTNSPTVEIYNVPTNTWRDGPPLPVAVNHAMATGTTKSGEVYVAGGYGAVVFGAVNTAFVLRDGVWLPLKPMPETRAAGSMYFHNGRVFVVGGFTQQGTLAKTTMVYDPETDAWSVRVGVRTPREHLTVAHGPGSSFVWAIGGRNGDPSTNMRTVELLDGPTVWFAGPPLLQARSGHVSAMTRNGLVVSAGGETATGVISSVEAYSLYGRRSLRLPSLSPGRTGFGGVAIGDKFYVFSGATMTDYLATTQVLDLRGVR